MHNHWHPLFDRVTEEWHAADVVRSVPSVEEGVSLGSGVTGPRDPNAPKRARKTVKKPVIDVDDLEDTGDRTIPSPATDLAASAFAVWNTANALVTESASI
jgi:hypothetical protein